MAVLTNDHQGLPFDENATMGEFVSLLKSQKHHLGYQVVD
jgi:hypothetical protein